jgi:hypothetical protein
MFMDEGNAPRPPPRNPIIKEVKEREKGKEVKEGTQRNVPA